MGACVREATSGPEWYPKAPQAHWREMRLFVSPAEVTTLWSPIVLLGLQLWCECVVKDCSPCLGWVNISKQKVA